MCRLASLRETLLSFNCPAHRVYVTQEAEHLLEVCLLWAGWIPPPLTIDSGHFKSSEWALPQRPAGCFSLRPCSFISPPQCQSSQLCSAFGELQLSNTICCWLKKSSQDSAVFTAISRILFFVFRPHSALNVSFLNLELKRKTKLPLGAAGCLWEQQRFAVV